MEKPGRCKHFENKPPLLEASNAESPPQFHNEGTPDGSCRHVVVGEGRAPAISCFRGNAGLM